MDECGLAARYSRDGFAWPVRVLSEHEASSALLSLAQYEADCGGAPLVGDRRFKLHVLLPWAAELVRHPALVGAVAAVLGTRDLVVWSSDLNVKEPQAPAHFTPHQDSTYMGLEPVAGVVTGKPPHPHQASVPAPPPGRLF